MCHFCYVNMFLTFLSRCACTETKINTIDITGRSNTAGPIVYLLKLLVHKGGFPGLANIRKDSHLKWIAVKEFEQDKVCVLLKLDLSL